MEKYRYIISRAFLIAKRKTPQESKRDALRRAINLAQLRNFIGDRRRSDVVDLMRAGDKIKLRQIDDRRTSADFADEDRWIDSAGEIGITGKIRNRDIFHQG